MKNLKEQFEKQLSEFIKQGGTQFKGKPVSAKKIKESLDKLE